MNNSFTPRGARGGKVFRNSRYGNQKPRRNGQYIDPARFVNEAIMPEAEIAYEAKHRFSDFGFMADLQRNIDAKGYTTPTPIQDQTIHAALEGRDVIGLANTGTGKTAAFVLPIIQQLSNQQDGKTALIMAPTRELAVQINDEFRAFAKDLRLYSALCVGGANINQQISQLRRGPQVVIGTPGRLKDLFGQRALRLDRTSILVLDEADRMLDMGFIRDIRFLISKLPERKQTLCFSATMPQEIKSLLNEMLHEPVTVSVVKAQTSDHVEQNVVRASSKEEKLQLLTEMLQQTEFEKVLVFGSTKYGVQRLADNLSKSGISAVAIHGNKTQSQRQRALDSFKKGNVKVMVATDVASRGLDIPLVSHVINFDQPSTYEDYTHRIGRTGRAGHRGNALTFVS
jgi:ATP-dependent RNA helicase RhlE